MLHFGNLSVGDSRRISCVELCQDVMVIGTNTGSLLCYELELSKPQLVMEPILKNIVYPPPHDKSQCMRVSVVKFSCCMQYLAVGLISGVVVIYKTTSPGKCMKVYTKYSEHGGCPISALAWAPDSVKLFSGCTGGRVVEVDLKRSPRENKIDEAFQFAVTLFGGATGSSASSRGRGLSHFPTITECGVAVKSIDVSMVNALSKVNPKRESLHDCLLVTPERRPIRHFLIPRITMSDDAVVEGTKIPSQEAFVTVLDQLLTMSAAMSFPAVVSHTRNTQHQEGQPTIAYTSAACFILDPAMALSCRQSKMIRELPQSLHPQPSTFAPPPQRPVTGRGPRDTLFDLDALNAGWSGLVAYGTDSIQRSGFGRADSSIAGSNKGQVSDLEKISVDNSCEDSFALSHLPNGRHDRTYILMAMSEVQSGKRNEERVCLATYCPSDQAVTRKNLLEVGRISSFPSVLKLCYSCPVYTAFGTLLVVLAITDEEQLVFLSHEQSCYQVVDQFRSSRVHSFTVSGAYVVVLHSSRSTSGVHKQVSTPAADKREGLKVDLLQFIHPEHVFFPIVSFVGLHMTHNMAQLQQKWRNNKQWYKKAKLRSQAQAIPLEAVLDASGAEDEIEVGSNVPTAVPGTTVDNETNIIMSSKDDSPSNRIDPSFLDSLCNAGSNSVPKFNETSNVNFVKGDISDVEEVERVAQDKAPCALTSEECYGSDTFITDESISFSSENHATSVQNLEIIELNASEDIFDDQESVGDVVVSDGETFHPWLHSTGGGWHDRWVDSLSQLRATEILDCEGLECGEEEEEEGEDGDMYALQKRIFSTRGRRIVQDQGVCLKKNTSTSRGDFGPERVVSSSHIVTIEDMGSGCEDCSYVDGYRNGKSESKNESSSFLSGAIFDEANVYSVDLSLQYSSLGLNLGIERDSNLLRVASFNIMPALTKSSKREPNVAQLCGLIQVGDILVGIGDVDVSQLSADEGLIVLKRIVSNAKLNRPLPSRSRAGSDSGAEKKNKSPVPERRARKFDSYDNGVKSNEVLTSHCIRLTFMYKDVIPPIGISGQGALWDHQTCEVEGCEASNGDCVSHGRNLNNVLPGDDDDNDTHNPLFDILGFSDGCELSAQQGGRRRSGGAPMLTSDTLVNISAELKRGRTSLGAGQVFPAVASRGDMMELVSAHLFLHDPDEIKYVSTHLQKSKDRERIENERRRLCSADGIERQIRKRHIYPRMVVANCILSQIDAPSLMLPFSEDIWSDYLRQWHHFNNHLYRDETYACQDWLQDSNLEAYRGLLDRLHRNDVVGLVVLLENEVQIVQRKLETNLQKSIVSSELSKCKIECERGLGKAPLSGPKLKSDHLQNVHVTTKELHTQKMFKMLRLREGSFASASDTTADDTDNDNDFGLVDKVKVSPRANKIIDPAEVTSGRLTKNHTSPSRTRFNTRVKSTERGISVNTRLPAVDVAAVLTQLVSLLSREQDNSNSSRLKEGRVSEILSERLMRSRSPSPSNANIGGQSPRSNVPDSAMLLFPSRGALRSIDPALSAHLPEVDLTCHVFDTISAVLCNSLTLSDTILPRLDLILLLWMNTFSPLLPANTENKTRYLLHHSSVYSKPMSESTTSTPQDLYRGKSAVSAGKCNDEEVKYNVDDIEVEVEERCMQEHKLRVGSLLNLHFLLHTVLPHLSLRGASSGGITPATPAETYGDYVDVLPLLPEFRLVLMLWSSELKIKKSLEGRLSQWDLGDLLNFVDTYGVYVSLDLVVTVCCQRAAMMGLNALSRPINDSISESEEVLYKAMTRATSLFIGMHIHHHHDVPPAHRHHGHRVLAETPDMFGYGYKDKSKKNGERKVQRKNRETHTKIAKIIEPAPLRTLNHPPSEHPEEVTMALHSLKHLLEDCSCSTSDTTHITGLCASRYPFLQPWAVLQALQTSSPYSATSSIEGCGSVDSFHGLNLMGVNILYEYYMQLFGKVGRGNQYLMDESECTEASRKSQQTLIHNWLELSLYLADRAAAAEEDTTQYLDTVENILFATCDNNYGTERFKYCYSTDISSKLCAIYGYGVDLDRQSTNDDGDSDGYCDDVNDDVADEAINDCKVGTMEEILQLFVLNT